MFTVSNSKGQYCFTCSLPQRLLPGGLSERLTSMFQNIRGGIWILLKYMLSHKNIPLSLAALMPCLDSVPWCLLCRAGHCWPLRHTGQWLGLIGSGPFSSDIRVQDHCAFWPCQEVLSWPAEAICHFPGTHSGWTHLGNCCFVYWFSLYIMQVSSFSLLCSRQYLLKISRETSLSQCYEFIVCFCACV